MKIIKMIKNIDWFYLFYRESKENIKRGIKNLELMDLMYRAHEGMVRSLYDRFYKEECKKELVRRWRKHNNKDSVIFGEKDASMFKGYRKDYFYSWTHDNEGDLKRIVTEFINEGY